MSQISNYPYPNQPKLSYQILCCNPVSAVSVLFSNAFVEGDSG